MEVLNESLEDLCEDLGGGEWEVEYSVCTPFILNLSTFREEHRIKS